jgi:large subunit ribosomal protein L31
MKEKIHPTYYPDAQVVCACGNTFTVGSTRKQIKVELCSRCHPFYTGERRLVDTGGRVERFQRRYRQKAE